jgi:hypothetical protein
MAEKYKSVLEKHNENRTHRVPTAEEEAIQPVYPEEYLVGGPGKAVASGFMGSGKKAAKDAARYRIAQTKIGERAIDINADKAAAEAFAKTKPGKATYEYIKNKQEQVAKDRSVNQIKDTARRSADRSSTNFFGEAGNAIGNEVYRQNENAAGDTYKKGGMTASRRADGCAVKGKTKGRMV